MLLALSIGLGTLALSLHSIAAFRRERIGKNICLAIALSICFASIAFWFEGHPPFQQSSGTPKPPGFLDGLILCLNSMTILGSEVNLMFRDRIHGAYGKVWRGILFLVAISIIASFLEPSVLSWVYPAVLGSKPLFRAIRRQSLGDIVFEFPRIHGDLWKSAGSGILIAGFALFGISIARGSVYQAILNFTVVIAADSMRRNAGRSIVRVEGIESHSRLIGWADLRSYEWFEQNGTEWLRLKNELQDLWIATPPVAQVNAAFQRVGLTAIA